MVGSGISFCAEFGNDFAIDGNFAVKNQFFRAPPRCDSGGAGKYRGGLGQIFEVVSTSDAPLTIRAEHGKLKTAPRGFRGGKDGAAGGVTLNGKPIPDKLPVIINRDDRVSLEIPGSGGMYAPEERDREAVLRDLETGLISADAAARDYKVRVKGKSGE